VSGGTSNERTTIIVNPGRDTFPWLNAIAMRFESYKFLQLRFLFCSSLGTDNDGMISMHPDYDPEDDNSPLTKSRLHCFKDSVRMPIWSSQTLTCSKQELNKRKTYFCRDRGMGDRLNDVCQLHIVTDTSHSGVVGELWVEYFVELQTPQIEDVHDDQMSYETEDVVANDELMSDTTTNTGVATIVSNSVGTFEPHIHNGDANYLQINKLGRYLVELYARKVAGNITGVTGMANHLNTTFIDSGYDSTSTTATKVGLFDVNQIPARIDLGNVTVDAGILDSVTLNLTRVDPSVITNLFI
jgi:hypothetical protein